MESSSPAQMHLSTGHGVGGDSADPEPLLSRKPPPVEGWILRMCIVSLFAFLQLITVFAILRPAETVPLTTWEIFFIPTWIFLGVVFLYHCRLFQRGCQQRSYRMHLRNTETSRLQQTPIEIRPKQRSLFFVILLIMSDVAALIFFVDLSAQLDQYFSGATPAVDAIELLIIPVTLFGLLLMALLIGIILRCLVRGNRELSEEMTLREARRVTLDSSGTASVSRHGQSS